MYALYVSAIVIEGFEDREASRRQTLEVAEIMSRRQWPEKWLPRQVSQVYQRLYEVHRKEMCEVDRRVALGDLLINAGFESTSFKSRWHVYEGFEQLCLRRLWS